MIYKLKEDEQNERQINTRTCFLDYRIICFPIFYCRTYNWNTGKKENPEDSAAKAAVIISIIAIVLNVFFAVSCIACAGCTACLGAASDMSY